MSTGDDQSDAMPSAGVGYGKPPVEHRFRKGRSGNPKGRPRKPRSVTAAINDALARPMHILQDGRRQRIKTADAMIRKIINDALKGDPKTTLHALETLLALQTADPTEAEPLTIVFHKPDGGGQDRK